MEIIIAIALIIIWLVVLTFGWNILVDGAVSLAKKFSISEAIIGLTIVAIGTSMPELVVSIIAGIEGNTEIAIGNVLGSNIANVFLILGITAIISPMMLTKSTRSFDLPVVIVSSLVFLVLVSDSILEGSPINIIGRIDGVFLLFLALVYIGYTIRHNNHIPEEAETEEVDMGPWKASLLIVGGVSLLLVGGKSLVTGAVDLATMLWLSESIIGLTIVAIGTSTPELATSIIAARRGKSDIAVGNIIGSNIMNLLVILGASAIVAPLPFLATSFVDLMVAILAPIVLLVLALLWKKNQIGKKEGIVLTLVYVAYLIYLILLETTK